MDNEYSEEVLRVAEITQTDAEIVHVLFQDLKSEEKVLDHLFASNAAFEEDFGDQYGDFYMPPTNTVPSATLPLSQPSPAIPSSTAPSSDSSNTEESKAKDKEDAKKGPIPKKPEIFIKPYTQLNTPAAKITKWIEVPIKEIREFSDYEIKYESVKADDIVCPICRMDFYDDMFTMSPSMIEDLNNQMIYGVQEISVVMFSKCKNHFYHKDCAEQLVKNGKCIKCAVCSMIYGIYEGDMPRGTMHVSKHRGMSCSGYEGFGTITISYQIPSGTRNGVHYYGTSRVGYLPDNKEGNEVLALLKKAFDRKLTFTVGTSVTTGQPNAVVWSGIHHKTSPSGGSSCYGYPDPTYFNRVKEELAARGVLPDS